MFGLDGHATFFLLSTEEKRAKLGIRRINSVLFLKCLLEADESPLSEIFINEDRQIYIDVLQECNRITNEEARPERTKRSTRKKERSTKRLKKRYAKKQKKQQEALKNIIDRKTNPYYPTMIYENPNNGKLEQIVFDEDMREFIGTFANISGNDKIGLNEITTAFIKVMPDPVRSIFKECGIRTDVLKEAFEETTNSDVDAKNTTFVIPAKIKSFITNLNEKLKGQECLIMGRDKECVLVWQTLQKQSKRNVILIGEPGVGKTSIVEKITFDIISGNCPEEFKDTQVLLLDVNASIAGTSYRGQAEERYAILTKFLEKTPNVILFIDEIHQIRGAGALQEGGVDLANSIKPILAGGNVRVIGATTSEEYEKYFSRDGAIKRRFRPIEIKEPKSSEVYPMLKKSIESLSKYHGVTISKEMVDYIILNSACFNNETKNPDRTKDLIDLSMVAAKQDGKTEVDKVSVLANFKYQFEYFLKMPESFKKSIAYHEAGHCVMTKCSKYFKHEKILAITIIPSETSLGKNVIEVNYQQFCDDTREYYIDQIASFLAGRVAESMFTGTMSGGAASDLEKATSVAYNVVSRLGLSSFGKNRVIFEEVNSPKVQDNVNDQIDFLIQEGEERAKQVITQNIDKVEALVKLLLNKGIIGEKEINEVFEQNAT